MPRAVRETAGRGARRRFTRSPEAAGTIAVTMSDASREQRPPPGLLSAGELSARRAAWRRQRARRQAGLLAALVAGVLTLAGAWLLLTGDSAGHVHANSQPRLAAGGQAPAPSRPLPAPRRPTGGNARAVERVLGYTSYVQLAGRHRRDVALTFDDGPSQYTPQILRVLRRMHAVATFFVIGRWARA